MTENPSHISVRYIDEQQAYAVMLLPTSLADRLSLYNLEAELAEWFQNNPKVQAVVSFETVEICSTDVINAVLRARRISLENHSNLALCCLSQQVQDVFKTLHITPLFTIAPTQDEAFAALKAEV